MLGIINVVGTLLKFPLKPLVQLAAKVPSGKLTGTGGLIGLAGGALSALTGYHIVTSENIVPIINACANVLVALGTVIASFGAWRAHAPAPSA